MLPSAMIILMATAVDKDYGKKLITRPASITDEYIGYLYTSLVKRGYLRKLRSRSYNLTPVGREAILEFIKKMKLKSPPSSGED